MPLPESLKSLKAEQPITGKKTCENWKGNVCVLNPKSTMVRENLTNLSKSEAAMKSIYYLNYKKNYLLRYNRLKNHFLGVKSPLSKQLCKVSLCIDTFVSGCWLMSATLSQFCRNFGNENSLCVRFKLATITEPSHELFPNPFQHCQNRHFSCFEDP